MTDLIVRSSPFDGKAEVLIEGLVAEYDGRYGANSRPGGARTEILRYPPEAFAPPLGDFLLLRRGDETIAGGAFMSHDDETAELKRIWTRDDLRRQGLARQIVLALEEAAAELGYTRAYLTTGFRQPEATGLYLSLGYRPLFDTTVDPTLYRSLPFEKHIGAKAGTAGSTAIYPPAASLDEATARVAIVKAEQEAKIAARLAAHRAATTQVAAA
ncbi:GNAT family N-acetyltransferase [Bosea sp. 2YAB26]|uniref:GNAT family N-acetyltransferase n=1 Tax=Bosea sp. 2YAB26 TaxID=3237478 RepID=UPI003F911E52